jgi:parvulin-like peptidyl-prolyl isomerase
MKIAYSQGVIELDKVIKFLALSGQAASLYREVIVRREATKKARELKIEASDEELQILADSLRLTWGLFSSQETLDFLSLNGLTEDDFADYCEAAVLIQKLKDHLADENKIREHFINNRSEFDLARISTMTVKEESLAGEIILQVTEEGADFHALARKYSLDESTKQAGGFLGLASRRNFKPEISAKVFNAAAGEVVGPFPDNGFIRLIYVEELIRAELNDQIRDLIKERIFDEWASSFLKGTISVTL